jgi:hypothetical protein
MSDDEAASHLNKTLKGALESFEKHVEEAGKHEKSANATWTAKGVFEA